MLDQIKEKHLVVYSVWVPILLFDTEKAVPDALKQMPDKRVQHYWDGKGDLTEAFKRVLQIDQPAWDVYFAYPGDAEWKDQPPTPPVWMHRLGALPPEKLFDGDMFAAEIKKLLQEKKRKAGK